MVVIKLHCNQRRMIGASSCAWDEAWWWDGVTNHPTMTGGGWCRKAVRLPMVPSWSLEPRSILPISPISVRDLTRCGSGGIPLCVDGLLCGRAARVLKPCLLIVNCREQQRLILLYPCYNFTTSKSTWDVGTGERRNSAGRK
jgi:hypothetical protein